MRILIFLMFICNLLPVKPKDLDRYAYCESCLTTAQEIDNAIKGAPAENRQTVVENLLNGGVCEKLQTLKHDLVSQENMISSCKHLLESHYDQFHVALMNKEPTARLDIVLCYEQSKACIGVKRQSFESSKTTSFESDIEALLLDNKEHVRIAQPVHSGSPMHSSDEL
ncbi:hypothetical protein JOQ06_010138 [Pogonophryne albipinna]|uniref:Saposin B-type domain-containing protein n=1 Tax=Pogonophryne albipinna TaxID=1090488 RepID=A0AAD6AVC2_9TELE|nr:hypothetical protein JOQ06_010138 [Pogonophryne albipinna]